MPFKCPISVLVVIYTSNFEVLLLERAAHPGFWQSVTGSLEAGESPPETARREVLEETGLACAQEAFVNWHLQNEYEIFKEWAHRYAPSVTRNTEHVFSLELPQKQPIVLSDEHRSSVWLPYQEAAKKCFSPTNAEAILSLPKRT